MAVLESSSLADNDNPLYECVTVIYLNEKIAMQFKVYLRI